MRLLSYRHDGHAFAGQLDDDGRITPLQRAGIGTWSAMRLLLEHGANADLLGADRPALKAVALDPVVPDPQAIWCAAGTYREHILETGATVMPEHPPWFLRVAGSLCAADAPIVRPTASDRLDYEGELAVVIGRGGRHIQESKARDHLAGYTCFNDGSVRDWQRHSSQIGPGKNFASTGALGPWLVSADAFGDPYAKRLETRLNGEVVQSTSIGDLMFTIERMVAYLSTICALRPGDVIATGTCSGVGNRRSPQLFMKPGDQVAVSIEGIGTLRNPIVQEIEP